ADAVAQAAARGADIAQISLGDPKSWKKQVCDFPGGSLALREAAGEAGLTLVVHSAFVINVASLNNRIRIPSRKLLQQTLDAAAEV
ncbi:deoxyribonuclease IV, partial [Pseudomonas sp. GP01-A8]